jgi:hypothetical protein
MLPRLTPIAAVLHFSRFLQLTVVTFQMVNLLLGSALDVGVLPANSKPARWDYPYGFEDGTLRHHQRR